MSGRISARAVRERRIDLTENSGCRTRIRTWARGSKVHCATATQSGIQESAEGRTRTDTGVASQQFLRLPRLPFRHSGLRPTFVGNRATHHTNEVAPSDAQRGRVIVSHMVTSPETCAAIRIVTVRATVRILPMESWSTSLS